MQASTVGTLAHEFQHLINASRRLYVNYAPDYEEVWLDEGLAHVAEELNFYTARGWPRGQPGTGGDRRRGRRQTRLHTRQPTSAGFDSTCSRRRSGGFADDDLATRGAGWSFLRYAADRSGGPEPSTWFSLVNSISGLANLQAMLGTDPLPWYRDFTAAIYADDAGLSPAAATRSRAGTSASCTPRWTTTRARGAAAPTSWPCATPPTGWPTYSRCRRAAARRTYGWA